MPASTIQNKREWNRSTFDDEDYGSAICLNFPKYAERLKDKIKVIAAAESKSMSHFIRDCVSEKIREIFQGKDNDFSIAICLNAAAGLIVSDKINSFKEAYGQLRKHILSGKVENHISKLFK